MMPAKNTRLAPGALLLCLLALAGARCGAQSAAATGAPLPELKVVVVESLVRGPGRITDYDRIDAEFTAVLSKRKWPVTIRVERFASNTPDDGLQLRVFYQGIYDEAPGDLTFHAWMILYDHGTKRDFGIVRFRYNPRPLQDREDVLDRVVRGAAVEAADRIEAALFPKAGGRGH
jgi:hypothetical protein